MTGKQIAWLGIIAVAALGLVVVSDLSNAPAPVNVALVPVPDATSTLQATSAAAIQTDVRSHAAPVEVPTKLSRANTTTSNITTPVPVVTLTIIDPDGTSSFTVALKQSADACAVLEEAKAEGKLRSLTLDDSYKSSFGSSYVREINGYSNNWTFTVGGKEPQGCSLSKPEAGDTIVWMFGARD